MLSVLLFAKGWRLWSMLTCVHVPLHISSLQVVPPGVSFAITQNYIDWAKHYNLFVVVPLQATELFLIIMARAFLSETHFQVLQTWVLNIVIKMSNSKCISLRENFYVDWKAFLFPFNSVCSIYAAENMQVCNQLLTSIIKHSVLLSVQWTTYSLTIDIMKMTNKCLLMFVYYVTTWAAQLCMEFSII